MASSDLQEVQINGLKQLLENYHKRRGTALAKRLLQMMWNTFYVSLPGAQLLDTSIVFDYPGDMPPGAEPILPLTVSPDILWGHFGEHVHLEHGGHPFDVVVPTADALESLFRENYMGIDTRQEDFRLAMERVMSAPVFWASRWSVRRVAGRRQAHRRWLPIRLCPQPRNARGVGRVSSSISAGNLLNIAFGVQQRLVLAKQGTPRKVHPDNIQSQQKLEAEVGLLMDVIHASLRGRAWVPSLDDPPIWAFLPEPSRGHLRRAAREHPTDDPPPLVLPQGWRDQVIPDGDSSSAGTPMSVHAQ